MGKKQQDNGWTARKQQFCSRARGRVGLRLYGSSVAASSFVVASAGGQPRPIAPDFHPVYNPIWSPDGKRLLFFATRHEPNPPTTAWWIEPFDGGAPAGTGALALFQQNKVGGRYLAEIWRAETNQIVFAAGTGDAVNLWQVGLSPNTWHATGAPVQLTFGAGTEVRPISGCRSPCVFAAVPKPKHLEPAR
jgi:hypothetical protein